MFQVSRVSFFGAWALAQSVGDCRASANIMITISVKGLRIVARLLSVGTSAVFDHLSRARTEPLAGRGPILKQRFDIAHPSVAIESSRGRSPGTLEVEPDDSESLGSSSTSGTSDGCCASEAVHRDHRIH